MKKRAIKTKVEPHQGDYETACDFSSVYRFVERESELALETSKGIRFTAKAAESTNRRVIRFFQDGREYARAYECCWGHYYNCNRTRIGMYCAPLDAATEAWFQRKVATLKTELEKLPSARQKQLSKELSKRKE